ncbi:MAG: hypothetical protein A2X94_06490 [Bdellovibrionales bacterium GWB1_55_8]|nr:MAG: hypothetical protein A2X94_06490 [Bdellovibrionales bacterium GWB1_55_8]
MSENLEDFRIQGHNGPMNSQTGSDTEWRRCSSCKKPIRYGQLYWVCNVSTCNRKRTGLVFCEVSCWDAHVPLMNHRESWAEERKAPTREEWQRMQVEDAAPKRRVRKTAEESPSKAVEKKAPEPPKVILRRPGSGSSN